MDPSQQNPIAINLLFSNLFIRGHVYAMNTNIHEGFLCFVGGKLIFCLNSPDQTHLQKFAEVIDTETLKVSKKNSL